LKSTSAKVFGGLHHVPPASTILMPMAMEKGVGAYFSAKAERRGVELSELVTEVLKRGIEINEARK